MVIAFSGTFDMAMVATSAVDHLQKRMLASDIAMVSPEHFYNFSRVRPITRIDASGNRNIDWPGIEIKVATFSDKDMIFVTGEEPHYRWSDISAYISEIAAKTGCEFAISLGAVNGLVPHTRDLPVYGYTTNADIAERLDLERPHYEGPTGYMASLNSALEDSGVPSVAVRVEVPHYLPSPPSPKAVRALLLYLSELVSVDTYGADLDSEVENWEQLVDQAVGDDPENVLYVSQLEEQFDSEEEMAEAGRGLVVELESFLQDRSISIDEPNSTEEPSEDSEEE